MRRVFVILVLAGLASASAALAEGGPVKMPSEVQQRLGLTVQAVKIAGHVSAVSAYLKVLDPTPLAQLDSDIATAAVQLEASQREADRLHALQNADHSVATKTIDAADAQARADAARLELLRRRVGLEWGAGLARLSDKQRSDLVGELAAGRTALVRLDTPSGEGLAGLSAVDLDLGPLGTVHAVVLGPARAADPRLQSPGLLARVSGPTAAKLSSGLTLSVRLAAGAAQRGVLVPRDAVIRADGSSWVYVRKAAESFERRELMGAAPQRDGLFVASGVAPGDQVVTTGAAALYAAENPAAGGDD